MKKISLIGAGGIGGELASLIALNSFGNIRLIDIDEGIEELIEVYKSHRDFINNY